MRIMRAGCEPWEDLKDSCFKAPSGPNASVYSYSQAADSSET